MYSAVIQSHTHIGVCLPLSLRGYYKMLSRVPVVAAHLFYAQACVCQTLILTYSSLSPLVTVSLSSVSVGSVLM